MQILKCKMCGGDITATEGAAYGTCDSCGTVSTLPKASDERLMNLFNRANQQRLQSEFDKALANYENILNEDSTNAEAHWCAVLCRYGIEYVEDPVTRERVPTCHRVQYESVLADPDYKAALEYAPDAYSRELYENEAKKIAEIQKGILAVSGQEKPYDIFICYKETTDGGSRTLDSKLAQDIYHQLEKDYRVFFSRITLEDKLGQQYEPYIFSALNSAKVMLVIGTRKEHFNAVWVKNEWSRFLALAKKDRSRLLIPCYRDMDAYDIPDELAAFQAQDMAKIGFIQDLTRGVKKVLDAEKAEGGKPTQPAAAEKVITAPGVESLMKRGWLFLEDGDWKQADEYFNKVLDIDPEYARAYAGLLCAELNVKTEDELAGLSMPIKDKANFGKAMRFADEGYRGVLQGYEEKNNLIAEQEREKKREQEMKLAEQEQEKKREQVMKLVITAKFEKIAIIIITIIITLLWIILAILFFLY